MKKYMHVSMIAYFIRIKLKDASAYPTCGVSRWKVNRR